MVYWCGRGGRGWAVAKRMKWASLAVAGALAASTATALVGPAGALSARPKGALAAGTRPVERPLGLGVDAPGPITVASGHVWVANEGDATVTELSATSGATLRVVHGSGAALRFPAAIVVAGGHVWVADKASDSVTVLDATRGVVDRVLDAPTEDLRSPSALAVDGNHVWVADTSGAAVTEFNASTMGLERVVRGAGLAHPSGLAIDVGGLSVLDGHAGTVTQVATSSGTIARPVSLDPDDPGCLSSLAADPAGIWVLDGCTATLLELDPTSAALVVRLAVPGVFSQAQSSNLTAVGGQVLFTQGSGALDVFDEASATFRFRIIDNNSTGGSITAANGALWVSCTQLNLVLALDAATFDQLLGVTGSPYELDEPGAMAVDGAHLWVVDTSGNGVTEINERTGALTRYIPGFDNPLDVTSDGQDVWVMDSSDVVTELDARTGAIVRTIDLGPNPTSRYADVIPSIVSDGSHVWAINVNAGIVELDPTTGDVEHVVKVGSDEGLGSAADDGVHLWFTDGSTLYELDDASGEVVRALSGPSYGFYYSGAIVADGNHVWVLNAPRTASDTPTVSEISVTTGQQIAIASVTRPPALSPNIGDLTFDGLHLWADWQWQLGPLHVTEFPEAFGSGTARVPAGLSIPPTSDNVYGDALVSGDGKLFLANPGQNEIVEIHPVWWGGAAVQPLAAASAVGAPLEVQVGGIDRGQRATVHLGRFSAACVADRTMQCVALLRPTAVVSGIAWASITRPHGSPIVVTAAHSSHVVAITAPGTVLLGASVGVSLQGAVPGSSYSVRLDGDEVLGVVPTTGEVDVTLTATVSGPNTLTIVDDGATLDAGTVLVS
jgi:streptogramin lyase